ncbi:hypothetical protein [Spirosoma radiotolerans]|uniref:Lipoprotein n=1 Tax=Spirosoma radiotolerans TaxID=1379870 RepID=A0A0E3ZWL4_9BACT|nr:hypothetical protein [Spirosoma radiotolerans]AKD55765.1 hypothetical protein SD10_13495 [Spirosoma radiotolerans]
MKRLIYAVTLLSVLSCTDNEKSASQEKTSPSTGQQPENSAGAPSNEPSSSPKSSQQNSPATGATTWTYENKVDKDGKTVNKAVLTSPTVLNFDFPYTGGSTVTLTLRHKNSLTYSYLEVSKGQFNRSFQGGNASIRFDGKPPVRYSLSAAENGRANIVFFDSAQMLINQMKGARKMVVDVEFEGQGKRHIEFTTRGLRWNH